MNLIVLAGCLASLDPAARTKVAFRAWEVEYAGKVVSEFMAEGKKMLELCDQLATSGMPKQP